MTIRYRNIKRDSQNNIVSGSAALVENTYCPNINGSRLQNHSKQIVIERLGKVIWLDENDKNYGIFDSPSRGLVSYNLKKDEFLPIKSSDSRLKGTKYQAKPDKIHTSFGSTYLFFAEMEKTPYMKVLRKAFPETSLYQRVLAHLSHDCLKNGSTIKCGEFLSENWLSFLLKEIPTSTLDCDTAYFKMLSDDSLKKDFFRALVFELQRSNSNFGRACYVDSTPLPGEGENNPFNALCSHGTDGTVMQPRLVLVLDIGTCIPIWFEIISSNILDKSTILSIVNDVKTTLNIDIDQFYLDAGYAKQELFELFNIDNNTVTDDNGNVYDHTVLVKMPATLGYPRDNLYVQCKPHFYNGRYSFDDEHHTFFGERVEIKLFGNPEYAFVFVDKTQAESLLRGWREDHLQEWNDLSDSAQEWYMVKDGFFILIGNKDQSPKNALIEYRSRTRIESFFRDGEAYLKILPISKWNKQTVKGKIFHDIIETIFYREYRKKVSVADISLSSLIVYMDSWECFKVNDDLLELKTPRLQVRELLEKLGYSVPGHIDLNGLRDELLDGKPLVREPVTIRKKRNTSKPQQPISPEEKIEPVEQQRVSKIIAEAEHKLEKAKAKAEQNLKKTTEKAKSVLEKSKTKASNALSRKLENSKRESTKVKAQTIYDQTIAIAEEVFSQAINEAKSLYNQAMKEANDEFKQVEEQVKKQLVNSYVFG